MLTKAGYDYNVIRNEILRVLGVKVGTDNKQKAKTAAKPPALEEFAHDLTKAAEKELLDPVIGREEEISRVIRILSRKRKNNPILIGEAGVGKTAIVEGLAQRIFKKQVPEKKLDESRKILEDKEKEYKVFNKLYEISVGKYGEKRNNITFQNYVLAVYFQDVLDRANDRLSIMTNNQYHMRLDTTKKGNAGSGLEVNVFDSHTGKERSIKTLSGGETFKASMALALGLSDVVQAQNGGIKLDSVFIDEGFGTLDEESLSVAMDILMELKSSGRTVGIISHVNELKQTITSQIKVEKTVRGSRAEVIY